MTNFTDLKKMAKMFTMIGVDFKIGRHTEVVSGNRELEYRHIRIYTRHKKGYMEFMFNPSSEKYLKSHEIYIDDFKNGNKIKGDDVNIYTATEAGNPLFR